MAFIDELDIEVKAGDGGDGVVRWRHEKYKPKAGPSGGDGGRGGDVYALGVRDSLILAKHARNSHFRAEDGEEGKGNSLHGRDGADCVIPLPVGSVLRRESDGRELEIVEVGEKVLLARGGRGGRGNESFKSSTNQTPYESTAGTPGEAARYHVELRLIADIGLVGIPNAGKSSLLNVFTGSRSKEGAYPFTTREPHLGVFYGYTMADIPGLIEGAHTGKGLGATFLRHIKRTKCLLHLVSLENADPYATYHMVRKELSAYDPELTRKPELVFLTKSDAVRQEHIAETLRVFRGHGHATEPISLYDDVAVKRCRDTLSRFMERFNTDVDKPAA